MLTTAAAAFTAVALVAGCGGAKRSAEQRLNITPGLLDDDVDWGVRSEQLHKQ